MKNIFLLFTTLILAINLNAQEFFKQPTVIGALGGAVATLGPTIFIFKRAHSAQKNNLNELQKKVDQCETSAKEISTQVTNIKNIEEANQKIATEVTENLKRIENELASIISEDGTLSELGKNNNKLSDLLEKAQKNNKLNTQNIKEALESAQKNAELTNNLTNEIEKLSNTIQQHAEAQRNQWKTINEQIELAQKVRKADQETIKDLTEKLKDIQQAFQKSSEKTMQEIAKSLPQNILESLTKKLQEDLKSLNSSNLLEENSALKSKITKLQELMLQNQKIKKTHKRRNSQ